jgi:RHS repeat-associated protein
MMAENVVDETRYLLSDGLGSIRQVVDESGAVVDYNEFDPYGNPLTDHVSRIAPYGYTGEWWEDDLGLLYLRARWYSTETGTFLSVDPVESEHPYLYVRGNPVRWIDPSGKYLCEGAYDCEFIPPPPPEPEPPLPPTSTPTPTPTSTPLFVPPTCSPLFPPQTRIVYLTFDDGPGWNNQQNKNTLDILDELKRRQIKATFFVLGQGVDAYPATITRMAMEGHTISSHSYKHPYLTTLTDGEIQAQITLTEDAVKNVLGFLPPGFRYFRPPYGDHDTRTDQIIRDMGYEIILWDEDSADYTYAKDYIDIVVSGDKAAKDAMVDNFAKNVITLIENSDVKNPKVLFHSIHLITVHGLPIILDALEEKGYRFAPM